MRRGIEQGEEDTYAQARREGRAVLDGEFSRAEKVRYHVTRPRFLAAAVGVIVLGGASTYAVAADHTQPLPVRETTVAGSDGQEYVAIVPDHGVYVDPDGGYVNITVSEPLPENIREDIEAGLEGLGGDASAIAEHMGERLNPTGKGYVVITAQQLSCDGVEYFDGFALSTDADLSVLELSGEDICDMQRTVEGARELADLIVASTGPTGGASFEVFEVLDTAGIPGAEGTDVYTGPTTESTDVMEDDGAAQEFAHEDQPETVMISESDLRGPLPPPPND